MIVKYYQSTTLGYLQKGIKEGREGKERKGVKMLVQVNKNTFIGFQNVPFNFKNNLKNNSTASFKNRCKSRCQKIQNSWQSYVLENKGKQLDANFTKGKLPQFQKQFNLH